MKGSMRILGIVYLTVVSMVASSARADTTYIYTGNDFNWFSTTAYPEPSPTPPPDSYYTTSDYLSISITLSEPPTTSGLPGGYSDVVNWSPWGCAAVVWSPGCAMSELDIEMTSDPQGGIVSWDITIAAGGFIQIGTENDAWGAVDIVYDDVGTTAVYNDPGSWSIDSSSSAIPEPSSFLLLATGLLGLGGVVTRKMAR